MSTFTVLTSSSGTLIVDRASIVVDRFGARGKSVNISEAITGKTYVIESTSSPDNARLILMFTMLTAAQAETLAAILGGGGVITARLKSGGSTFAVAYSGAHSIEAIIGNYPDATRAGAALDARLTPHRASVTFYRVA